MQIIGFDILKLRTNENQQALFVLDRMLSLPESEPLLKVLKGQHVHVIVLYQSYKSVDKLIKEVDYKLVRGCKVYDVKPLSVIHSTQRIVHSIVKSHDFTPTNQDQQTFEKLAEFTAGSPLLIEIVSTVVDACFRLKECPMQHLSEVLTLDTTAQVKECKVSDTVTTKTISENVCKLVGDANIFLENPHDIWATHTQYDSWDSFLRLIDACDLTSQEKLLLDCLSIFGSIPVPFSVVTELASLIAKGGQKPHLAGTLHCKLLNYKLLQNYPQPLILHSSLYSSPSPNTKFVFVPQQLSDCIWNNSEDVDKVCVVNLAFSTLSTLYQTTDIESIAHFLCGACTLLLETCESNLTLIDKKCYQAVYNLLLSFHKLP